MKYRQAMAAVLAKYKNPRTRTAAAALLERYASATRPVTAWHALGEDADASRLLLETLGFEEGTHFTVQTSVLDPGAHRFTWTESGLKLVAAMPRELARVDFPEIQKRILVPNGKEDPAALLPDVATAEVQTGVDPGITFGTAVLEKTLGIARRIKVAMTTVQAAANVTADTLKVVDRWADRQLDPNEDREIPMPIAPLAVLEALARMEGEKCPGFPETQIFRPDVDMDTCACSGWQASRIVTDGERIPSGRLNAMPLTEQKMSGGTLDSYFAWTREEWKRFDGNRGKTAWTQFDARVCQTAEALNFALDADAMRRFVLAILACGYGTDFRYALSSSTRLAVSNIATAEIDDHSGEDEGGDTNSFGYRMEDSAMPSMAPVYMGAHIITADHIVLEPGAWAPPTHPVRIADGTSEDDAGDGLRAAEIAEEWFMIVHGGATWPRGDEHPWQDHENRLSLRRANLPRFRSDVGRIKASPATLLHLCSPDNPRFCGNGCSTGFTPEGAFVNGLCAAVRKFSEGELEFVDGSPYFPEKFVAGVWSGLMTDLGPLTVDEAREANVFPWFTSFQFDSHTQSGEAAKEASKFIDLMREVPSVQMRFGKRTKGEHRPHAIVVETNVSAGPFIEALRRNGNCEKFVKAGWRAFYVAFLVRMGLPLAALDPSFSAYGNEGNGMSGFDEFAKKCCPDWAVQVAGCGIPKDVPDGFRFGWREDRYGRLLLVVRTSAPWLAMRAKLAYRYDESLPLPSAAWLAAHGQCNVVAFTSVNPAQRYRELLAVAARQPGFDRGQNVTLGSRGRFGVIWFPNLVADMDSDEVPGRGWYSSSSMESADVYVRPF